MGTEGQGRRRPPHPHLRRVRKGMEAADKPVRIDIHMSNAGGCHDPGWQSPTLNYAQHFSHADSLWFGEG